MITFNQNDTYKVSHINKNEKQAIDYKVLTRLYTPLIGSIATSLYLVLESELALNKKNQKHNNMLRLTKLSKLNMNQLNEALAELEKYKLVEFKGNKRIQDDYLIVLKPCKSAIEILEDTKFVDNLQVTIDSNYLEQIKNYFISSDDISSEYVSIENISLDSEPQDELIFERLYTKYPVNSLSWYIDENTKKEILRLKKLFKLNYDQIEAAMLNSFVVKDDTTEVDVRKLNEYIEKVYGNSVSSIIDMFEREKPINYYSKMLKRNLFPRETDMINELLDRYKICDGIMNTIINYYFNYKKNSNGDPRNYFIKIIESMKMAGVETTKDAVEYLRENNQKYKKQNENKKEQEKPQESDADVESLIGLLKEM